MFFGFGSTASCSDTVFLNLLSFIGPATSTASTAVQEVMGQAGWKLEQQEKDGGTLYFSQKGAWREDWKENREED